MKIHEAVAPPAKNTFAVLRIAVIAASIALVATVRPVGAAQMPTNRTPATPTAESVETLEATVKSSPTPANRLSLSRAYINAGQPEHAILVLLSLVAEDKSNALAWNNLCVANILQQAYTAAVENCNRAIALEPNNQLARNNLRWAEDEQKKAISDLVGGQKAPPAARDAAFYVDKGLSQLNAGQPDAAIASWQHALELDPRNGIAANNIGDAYMVKKQPDTALQWFVKASFIDPTLQLAKNNIVWA